MPEPQSAARPQPGAQPSTREVPLDHMSTQISPLTPQSASLAQASVQEPIHVGQSAVAQVAPVVQLAPTAAPAIDWRQNAWMLPPMVWSWLHTSPGSHCEVAVQAATTQSGKAPERPPTVMVRLAQVPAWLQSARELHGEAQKPPRHRPERQSALLAQMTPVLCAPTLGAQWRSSAVPAALGPIWQLVAPEQSALVVQGVGPVLEVLDEVVVVLVVEVVLLLLVVVVLLDEVLLEVEVVDVLVLEDVLVEPVEPPPPAPPVAVVLALPVLLDPVAPPEPVSLVEVVPEPVVVGRKPP